MQSSSSEFILRPDGSVYHLALRPEQVATTIITVGDPERVERISRHFDQIEHRVQHREFVTHTGYLGDKRLTVISTGIGSGNIDIVINELDALFNFDLEKGGARKEITPLTFVRIGTSGCLQEDIPVDSLLVSQWAMGLDGLLHYYDYTTPEAVRKLEIAFAQEADIHLPVPPYFSATDSRLMARFGDGLHRGITLTCGGFYGPQGRALRLSPWQPKLLDKLSSFQVDGLKATNFEMETASLYALAGALGHRAISLNALIANRASGTFSADPGKTIDRLISRTLQRV